MPEHLTLERLAALADEAAPAAAAETAHLAACERCRRELATLRRLQAAVAALPARQPPADQWDRLAARHRFGRARWFQRPGVLRLAAAFVLVFGGGLAVGLGLRSRTNVPGGNLPPGLSALPPQVDTFPPTREKPVFHDLKLIVIVAVATVIVLFVVAAIKGRGKKGGTPPQS